MIFTLATKRQNKLTRANRDAPGGLPLGWGMLMVCSPVAQFGRSAAVSLHIGLQFSWPAEASAWGCIRPQPAVRVHDFGFSFGEPHLPPNHALQATACLRFDSVRPASYRQRFARRA